MKPESTKKPLKILFQDRHLIVVDKPGGMMVYGESGVKGVKEVLEAKWNRKIYPVHRLDRDTSGVLVFALTGEMASDLIRAFQHRKMKKKYRAVALGDLESSEGKITFPLPRNKGGGEDPARTDFVVLRRAVLADFVSWKKELVPEGGGESGASEPKASSKSASLSPPLGPQSPVVVLDLDPRTGRFHQIRRHLGRVGLVILGDALYAKGPVKTFFQKKVAGRMYLHATEIEFVHPRTRELLRISSPAGY